MKTQKYFFDLHSINNDQKLYVLSCGKGFSCYGFDVVENKIRRLLKELKSDIDPVDLPAIGSNDHYYLYCILSEYVLKLNKETGFRSQTDLNPKLIGLEGKRIEAKVYGEVSRFTVGRSTGWIPCHLEIKTGRSGGALPSDPEQIEVLRIIAN